MRTERGVERDDEFVAFVRDAQPRLCRVAYLVCGNWHLAEDTVQASLVKLYLNWDRVDREAGPWAYARRTWSTGSARPPPTPTSRRRVSTGITATPTARRGTAPPRSRPRWTSPPH